VLDAQLSGGGTHELELLTREGGSNSKELLRCDATAGGVEVPHHDHRQRGRTCRERLSGVHSVLHDLRESHSFVRRRDRSRAVKSPANELELGRHLIRRHNYARRN